MTYYQYMEQTAAKKNRSDDDRPLRIVVHSATAIDDEYPNGVLTTEKKFLEYFQSQGHHVKVISPKTPGVPDSISGFDIKKVASTKVQGFYAGTGGQNKIPRLFTHFKPEGTVVFSPFDFSTEVTVNTSRFLGVPIVSLFMTDIAQYAFDQGNATIERYSGASDPESQLEYTSQMQFGRGLAHWSLRAIRLGHNAQRIAAARHAYLHNLTDLTLVPSKATEHKAIRYGIHKKDIEILSRGVDSDMYNPERRSSEAVQKLRIELGVSEERPMVLYVGRMAPEKDLETLMALKPLFGRIRLVMVGDGPSRAEIEKLLGPDVLFVGAKSGEELANYYAAADIFVHPGTKETFGQTVQESKASGVVPIAPDIGGPVDTIEHGVTGFRFNPNKPHELREYVELLINDPDRRRNMGIEARKSIEGVSWAAKAEELIQHTRGIINLRKISKGLARQSLRT
jgi:phosphatidylinositol alpha 1,6-mannosyltransferase